MSKPSEKLRNVLAEAEGARRNGVASDGRGWFRTAEDRDDCYAVADTMLATLVDACEVREEWSVRWHLDGEGNYDEQDCHDKLRETAEQRARRLAARPPVGVLRGEALRRLILTTPPESVSPGTSEPERQR